MAESRKLHLHYSTRGNGPPVVMLHGVASSSREWDALIPELARAGFQTYAPDLLGHGDSSKPKEPRKYSAEQIYTQFEEWLTSLHLPTPPVLIGHSLGGFLSLAYAIHHPGQVHGLFLINPFYTPRQLPPRFQWLRRYPEWGEKALEMAPYWLVRLVGALEPYDARYCTERALLQAAKDARRASPAIARIPASLPDLTPRLDEVNCKTLILWGDRDLTLEPRSFPRLVATLPNAHGRPIHGRGHKPHLSSSRETCRLILDFLTALSAQPDHSTPAYSPDHAHA